MNTNTNPMGGGGFNAGANQASFKKDGFNLLGNEPLKKPGFDDSQNKEFADLFSMADTKIKDRGD